MCIWMYIYIYMCICIRIHTCAGASKIAGMCSPFMDSPLSAAASATKGQASAPRHGETYGTIGVMYATPYWMLFSCLSEERVGPTSYNLAVLRTRAKHTKHVGHPYHALNKRMTCLAASLEELCQQCPADAQGIGKQLVEAPLSFGISAASARTSKATD